jgi:hypothetical protein
MQTNDGREIKNYSEYKGCGQGQVLMNGFEFWVTWYKGVFSDDKASPLNIKGYEHEHN